MYVNYFFVLVWSDVDFQISVNLFCLHLNTCFLELYMR